MAESLPAEVPRRRAASFWALRHALGRAPIWLVVFAIEGLLPLAPALITRIWLNGAIEHRYPPGSLFSNLDPNFRFDWRQDKATLDEAMGMLGSVLVAIAVLFGTFSAGGWLQVFLERTEGHSLQRFFLGGARYFWRFLRLTLVTVLVLCALTWIVHGPGWNRLVLRGLLHVPANDVEKLETFTSEWSVTFVRWSQQAIYAVGFGLVLVWGDYARTRLALHDTASAVWSGICTAFTMLRHPLRTLRPVAGLFALEVLVVVAAGLLARRVEEVVASGSGLGGVGLLFAISLFALLWRIVLRGARYHAAVQVSREVVRPIARPDPWKGSLGPEGGPRYPLGGDEYGMSL